MWLIWVGLVGTSGDPFRGLPAPLVPVLENKQRVDSAFSSSCNRLRLGPKSSEPVPCPAGSADGGVAVAALGETHDTCLPVSVVQRLRLSFFFFFSGTRLSSPGTPASALWLSQAGAGGLSSLDIQTLRTRCCFHAHGARRGL